MASGLRPLPGWKRDADFLFVQVSFSIDELLEWRSQIDFAGPIYAGMMVPTSAAMARKLGAQIPQLAVPSHIVEALERDPHAGVSVACDLVEQIRESTAFTGVHLIAVSRYREAAARLEPLLRT